MVKTFWKMLLYLTLSVLASSCSLPKNLVNISKYPSNYNSGQLQQITISSFWTNRFTGIMALTIDDSKIHYALLDTMGIKLLESEVFSTGKYEVSGGVKKLIDSRLPGIMAESLLRIYRVEPTKHPCSTSFWNALCQKKLDDGSRIKYCRSGPFVHWRVRFESDTNTVYYNRPIIGFTLKLTPMNPTSTQGES